MYRSEGIYHCGGAGEADHRDHGGEHEDFQCRGIGKHAENVCRMAWYTDIIENCIKTGGLHGSFSCGGFLYAMRR